MLIILTLCFSIFTLVIAHKINVKLKDKFNPYSIMIYIWDLFMIGSVTMAKSVDFYPMSISGIILVFSFLVIIGITLLLFLKLTNVNVNKNKCSVFIDVNRKDLCRASDILFIIYIICNIIYWSDINRIIGIKNVISNPWLLKHYILTGVIVDHSLRYVGRNLALIGSIITITYFGTKKKKYLVMIFVYIVLAVIDIRREPVIIKLTYVLVIVLLMNKQKIKKILKVLLPTSVLFLAFFFITLSVLNIENRDIQKMIYAYTSGSFNSLQALIDSKLMFNNPLLLNHTFYWIYAFLKYLNPAWSTPEIILPTIGANTTNVYTALSYVVIDSGGDYFLMIMIMIIYAIYVGICIGIAIKLINKKVNFLSISIYSAVMACVVRSFMNSTFSHMDIIFAVIYGGIIQLLFAKRKVCNNGSLLELNRG